MEISNKYKLGFDSLFQIYKSTIITIKLYKDDYEDHSVCYVDNDNKFKVEGKYSQEHIKYMEELIEQIYNEITHKKLDYSFGEFEIVEGGEYND